MVKPARLKRYKLPESIRVHFKLRKEILLLLAILLAGLLLRLIFFNGLNWDDDPDYVWRVNQVIEGRGFIYQDNNGLRVGTFLPAALAYLLFGINNFSVGLYALVVSMLGIYVVFLLGRLLFNARTGLIAALLWAFYPLDVELASRLMPDGLLAGFSLFALYFLFKGDKKNKDSQGSRLLSIGSYILSGLLLAWCTIVNMSAFVLVPFYALYFFYSIYFFRDKIGALGFRKGFLRIVVLRYMILVGAFFLVAAAEGFLYLHHNGDFFFKYKGTLDHYSDNHGFNQDLSMYPRIMFHVTSGGRFQYQGRENSTYGFFYLIGLFALVFAFFKLKTGIASVLLWFFAVFIYLQWGSMSFTNYMPFHRLPRHLSILTPAIILLLAFFFEYFRPKEIKRWLSPILIGFLCLTSLYFSFFRHQSLEDAVAPQKVIHNYLEFRTPAVVYAANNTVAYQKFLDRFKDKGRSYRDIRSAPHNREEEAVAIFGEHRNWWDTARLVWRDRSGPPENWELDRTIEVEGRLDRPPHEVRFYNLLTIPIAELKLQNMEKMRAFLLDKFPEEFEKSTRLILSWESRALDGVDELVLREENLILRHIEYQEPKDVNYRLFSPLERRDDLRYRVIKENGRGEIAITSPPGPGNGYTLTIRIDDGPFPAQDYYRFFLVADEK